MCRGVEGRGVGENLEMQRTRWGRGGTSEMAGTCGRGAMGSKMDQTT